MCANNYSSMTVHTHTEQQTKPYRLLKDSRWCISAKHDAVHRYGTSPKHSAEQSFPKRVLNNLINHSNSVSINPVN